jgi:DNA-binding XRE family transcriptional regulator
MGKIAASGYLQRLRELRGISRAYVAKVAGTSEQNIFRIEVESQEPRAELLASFILAIKGDIVDVYELLISSDASREDGERRAEELFTASQHREHVAHEEEVLDQSSPPTAREVRAKQTEIRELRSLIDRVNDRLRSLEDQ